MQKETEYLLATDPSNPDLCQYILRLKAPVTLIAVLNMDINNPVIKEERVTKDYTDDKTNEIFQFAAMPLNDGISEFNLSTLAELEWILDETWNWFKGVK